jgi:hypothetical protein
MRILQLNIIKHFLWQLKSTKRVSSVFAKASSKQHCYVTSESRCYRADSQGHETVPRKKREHIDLHAGNSVYSS